MKQGWIAVQQTNTVIKSLVLCGAYTSKWTDGAKNTWDAFRRDVFGRSCGISARNQVWSQELGK